MQAQNLISQHADATIELASPRGFSINPEKPVDVATSTFIGDTVEHRQLLDGLVSMIGPALDGIFSDLKDALEDIQGDVAKLNQIKSDLVEILQKAITGNYEVSRTENGVVRKYNSIDIYVRCLREINQLWRSVRGLA